MPAAIFDLDRTLIPGSSMQIFAKHLAEAGLGPSVKIPFLNQFFKAFESVGETMPSMQIAKRAARGNKGWSVELVEHAASQAAIEIAGMLQPFAPQLIDEHRSAGHQLVLATTTAVPLVAPLAKLLNFDALVATKWSIEDGKFNGTLDGPFLWGRDKMLAVKDWAESQGVDLKTSHAYSDSFYDGALLDLVGHPTAVNPDPKLQALALVKDWPIRNLDISPGVLKIGGREIQDWMRPLGRPELVPYASFEFSGLENIPASGPVILAFNHRSYFDPTAIGLLIAKSGRPARFLGKREVFDAPIIGNAARSLGAIPVDRASGSDEPLKAAAVALNGGEMVALAPQGTIPRGPAFFEPELTARWGTARLAALTGAPVVPIGVWGTERVWPRSARLPSLKLPRPTVSICVGPAIEFDQTRPEDENYKDNIDANTKQIMASIVELLPDEARASVTPTPEQLAATYPPGYDGDASQEVDRRPGTDTKNESAPNAAHTENS